MAHISRDFPFFSRRKDSLALDILFGAAGGALATWLMGYIMEGTSKALPEKLQKQSVKPTPPQDEGATEKVARTLLVPVGIPLQGEQKRKAGLAVHWTYGITWGALYGAMHHVSPLTGKLFGLGFGLGLFVFGDELLIPALKLGPTPLETPTAVHLSALVGHLAYGGITEASFRLLRRARNA
ncbi:MAG: DUF1440 domain-containing protein [Cystobacter sp.]